MRTPSLLLSFGFLGVLGDFTHVGALRGEHMNVVCVCAMRAYVCLSVVLACGDSKMLVGEVDAQSTVITSQH